MSKEDEKNATRSSITNSGISGSFVTNKIIEQQNNYIGVQNIIPSSTPQNFEEKLTEGNNRFGMLFNHLPGKLNFRSLK